MYIMHFSFLLIFQVHLLETLLIKIFECARQKHFGGEPPLCCIMFVSTKNKNNTQKSHLSVRRDTRLELGKCLQTSQCLLCKLLFSPGNMSVTNPITLFLTSFTWQPPAATCQLVKMLFWRLYVVKVPLPLNSHQASHLLIECRSLKDVSMVVHIVSLNKLSKITQLCRYSAYIHVCIYIHYS